MKNEPLGLPRGSVRAVLTLVMVAGTIVLAVLACVGFEPPSYVWVAFASALTLVLRDYFGFRGGSGEGEAPTDESDIAKDE